MSDLPPRHDPNSYAEVSRLGHRIWFRARDVDAMPDDVLQDLIAHELAHVLQDANGISIIDVDEDDRPVCANKYRTEIYYEEEIEADADFLIEQLGFDPYSIDHWSLSGGRATVDEPR